MKKTIAFFIRSMSSNKPPFVKEHAYDFSLAYQEYLLAMRAKGVDAYFVAGNDSYLGHGRFSQAWTVDKVGGFDDFRPVGEITADIVYEKGGFTGTDIPVVTDPAIIALCNKAETYKRFAKYQPQSVECADEAQMRAAIASMPGDMVVVKSPTGSSGHQVYIAKKAELTIPPTETYPLLVQEFVDMNDGIPGLAEGVHDLRILVAGDRIIGGTLRQALPGKFHANTGQGGSQRLLSYDEIPADARELATEINEQIGGLPHYCAIDFAKGKQGWRMIELNGKPGIYYTKLDGPLAAELRDGFVDYIVGLAQETSSRG